MSTSAKSLPVALLLFLLCSHILMVLNHEGSFAIASIAAEIPYEKAQLPSNTAQSELVIGLNPLLSYAYEQVAETVTDCGGTIVNSIVLVNRTIAMVANLPSSTVSLLSEAKSAGIIRYIEPRRQFGIDYAPNDVYWNQQWGPRKIEVDWVWNTTFGSQNTIVAVIDTGVDYTHPDLVANYMPLGRDWANNDEDPLDDHGHGTHCAGILAASIDNAIGIAGIANISIMAEKALDSSGLGWDDHLAGAIIHAVDQGARILSNSWGGDEDSQIIHDAIRYAVDQGVLVLAAAGNTASSIEHYPAAYQEVVAITATTSADSLAGFTTYGDWVELAAPGVSIYSTLPTYHVTLNDYGVSQNYSSLSGTSMACPHVAGTAALIWNQFPNASVEWIRYRLKSSADDLGSPGFDQFFGYGRINARRGSEEPLQDHDLAVAAVSIPPRIQTNEYAFLNASILNFGSSEEHNCTVQLVVDGNPTDSNIIHSLSPYEIFAVSLVWNPVASGIYNITVHALPVAGETSTGNNILTMFIEVVEISLIPNRGPAGTKTTLRGRGLAENAELEIRFNDAYVGSVEADVYGSFEFVFNVPLSEAGPQTVKILDASAAYMSTIFTVLDTTPLSIGVDVGSIYFRGEVVEFYAQTTFKGHVVNASIERATLYKPTGTSESLTAQSIAPGLFRFDYTVPGDAEHGIYTLVIEANYIGGDIESIGASFRSFLISAMLSDSILTIQEIQGNIATVLIPNLGTIETNLTTIGAHISKIDEEIAEISSSLGTMYATFEAIHLKITSTNETIALISTDLGNLKGTIASLNNNLVTIVIPGIGTITQDLSGLLETELTWTFPQSIAVAILSFVAATASVFAVLQLSKKSTHTK